MKKMVILSFLILVFALLLAGLTLRIIDVWPLPTWKVFVLAALSLILIAGLSVFIYAVNKELK